MKKKYESPYLAVESFQLDAAIAGDCSDNGMIALNHYDEDCGVGEPELEAGTPGIKYLYWGNICELNVVTPGGDDNDEFCYHAMTYSKFIYS